MPLSSGEQRILTAIENELNEKDPALVAIFTKTRLPSPVSRFSLSAHHTFLLILALLTLVIVHILVPQLGLAGSAVLTGMLIVPWIVSASWAAKRWNGKIPKNTPERITDQDP